MKKPPLVQDLEQRLKKLSKEQRRRIVHGIYKELVPSRRGKQARGPYRDYLESGEDPTPLVSLLEENLKKHGFPNHARRLIETIYHQIIPNSKGRQETGPYRNFVEAGVGDYLNLVDFVIKKLEEYQEFDRAKKLRAYYALDDSWLENNY